LWPMLQSELGDRCSFLPRDDSGKDLLRRTNHDFFIIIIILRLGRRPSNHHIRLFRRGLASHHLPVWRLGRSPANYNVLILCTLCRRLAAGRDPLQQPQQCRDSDMTGHHDVPPDRYICLTGTKAAINETRS